MDPQIALKLLEGHKDVISPLQEEREKFYRGQTCPGCGGNAFTKTGDSRLLFRHQEPLPRYLLQCDNCDCVFDPHTGIQLTMGNRAKAYVPTIPILEGPD